MVPVFTQSGMEPAHQSVFYQKTKSNKNKKFKNRTRFFSKSACGTTTPNKNSTCQLIYRFFLFDCLFAAIPLFRTKSLIFCTVLCDNSGSCTNLQWLHSVLVASFPLLMWSPKCCITAATSASDHTFFGTLLDPCSRSAPFPGRCVKQKSYH